MISPSPSTSPKSDQSDINDAKVQFKAKGTLTIYLQRRIANIVKQTGSNPLFGVFFGDHEFDTELLQQGAYDPPVSIDPNDQGLLYGDVTDRDTFMPLGDTDDLRDK